MFAGCYLPAYSHCVTGVNMLTHNIHTLHKPFHQSSPTQCCWPAVCPDQSDCWVQERGTVVWTWTDKEAAPCHPFTICLSFTHLPPSVYPPPCPHYRLPSTNTCSHYLCCCSKSPALADVYVFVCLCPCPYHLPPYPEPPASAIAEPFAFVYMCACVLLALSLNCLISL